MPNSLFCLSACGRTVRRYSSLAPVWLCWLVWDKQADPRSVRWDWGRHCGYSNLTVPKLWTEHLWCISHQKVSRYVTSTLWPVQAPVSTTWSAWECQLGADREAVAGFHGEGRAVWEQTPRYNKQTAFPYFLFKVYLTILTFWSSCFNRFFWRKFYCIYCLNFYFFSGYRPMTKQNKGHKRCFISV